MRPDVLSRSRSACAGLEHRVEVNHKCFIIAQLFDGQRKVHECVAHSEGTRETSRTPGCTTVGCLQVAGWEEAWIMLYAALVCAAVYSDTL